MPKINNKLQMVLVWLTFYPVSKFLKKILFKKTKDIDRRVRSTVSLHLFLLWLHFNSAFVPCDFFFSVPH